MTFWSSRKTAWLERRLISKFMTSQPGSKTIAISMLPNVSRSKDNQTMKFGQLLKCNLRNIFLEKSYTKCRKETIPRLFSKKIKLDHISGSIVQSLCFYCTQSWGLLKYIEEKLSCRSLAFTSYKAFWNNKKRSGTSLPASFSTWFLEEFYYQKRFHCPVIFTS